MIPDEFGVSKSWLYPVSWIFRRHRRANNTPTELETMDNSDTLDSSREFENANIGNFKTTEEDIESSIPSIVRIEGLTKNFGDFTALKSINLDLKKGKITSLIGHNGAGKSTLVNTLCGIIQPDSGKIEIEGQNLQENYDEIKNLIGYCPSYDVVYEELTVYEHLQFVSKLKGIKRADIHDEITEQLERFDLFNMMATLISDLSGGSLRKLTLASALIGSPSLLILDEPTNGVDASARKSIWQYLQKEKETRQTSILLTTHYLMEAEKLSDL